MLARLLGVFHVRLATPEIHFNELYVQCETFTFDVYVYVCVCGGYYQFPLDFNHSKIHRLYLNPFAYVKE